MTAITAVRVDSPLRHGGDIKKLSTLAPGSTSAAAPWQMRKMSMLPLPQRRQLLKHGDSLSHWSVPRCSGAQRRFFGSMLTN